MVPTCLFFFFFLDTVYFLIGIFIEIIVDSHKVVRNINTTGSSHVDFTQFPLMVMSSKTVVRCHRQDIDIGNIGTVHHQSHSGRPGFLCICVCVYSDSPVPTTPVKMLNSPPPEGFLVAPK